MKTHLRVTTFEDGKCNYELVLDEDLAILLGGSRPNDVNSAETRAHDISKFIQKNSLEVIDYRGAIEYIIHKQQEAQNV